MVGHSFGIVRSCVSVIFRQILGSFWSHLVESRQNLSGGPCGECFRGIERYVTLVFDVPRGACGVGVGPTRSWQVAVVRRRSWWVDKDIRHPLWPGIENGLGKNVTVSV